MKKKNRAFYRYFIPVIVIPLMNCFWNIINTIDAGIIIREAAAIVAERSDKC